MKIFHGSWNCFEQFDFNVANHFSTNGAAFYGSTSPLIARNYAYREARRRRTKPYLYSFELPDYYGNKEKRQEIIITDSKRFSEDVVLVKRIGLSTSIWNLFWRIENLFLELYKSLTIPSYRERMAWRKKVNRTLYHESPILNFMTFKTECGFAASCHSAVGSWNDFV